jgi:hypothetical protein
MTRIPVAIAGLALAAVTATGCGSDDGDDTTASDPSTSSAPASPSPSDSPTASASPSASDAPTDTGDPVPSPIIDKAVKDAIADGFPALVPAGVPSGWTVLRAAYGAQDGGGWTIAFTDPGGAPVTLVQSTADLDAMVAQLFANAEPDGKVDLSDYGTGKWNAYTSPGGAALAKSLADTSAVIIGPDQDTLVTLAQELLTAEDSGSGDDGG